MQQWRVFSFAGIEVWEGVHSRTFYKARQFAPSYLSTGSKRRRANHVKTPTTRPSAIYRAWRRLLCALIGAKPQW